VKRGGAMWGLALLLLVAFFASLAFGEVSLPLPDVVQALRGKGDPITLDVVRAFRLHVADSRAASTSSCARPALTARPAALFALMGLRGMGSDTCIVPCSYHRMISDYDRHRRHID